MAVPLPSHVAGHANTGGDPGTRGRPHGGPSGATEKCLVYRRRRPGWVEHRWEPLDRMTTLTDGTRLDWVSCRGCGQVGSR